MYKIITKVICAVSAVLLAGCSVSVPQKPTSEPTQQTPQAQGYKYTFQPHVLSEEYTKIYGENFEEEFYVFCDAVTEGKETFPCSSREIFQYMMNAARTCFPPAYALVDRNSSDVQNGICYLQYRKDPAQVREEIQQFREKVTRVITEAVPYDVPAEIRAMELLTYVAHKDTYDGEHTLDAMLETNPYRAVMQDIGICQEITGEYIYYLLQTDINAFSCSALSRDQSEAHEWAMMELDGKYYHTDPTYTINYPDSLFFFGMTDTQREYYGDLPPENYSYAESDLPERETYRADDQRFLDLWLAESYEIDPVNRTITVKEHETGKISTYSY